MSIAPTLKDFFSKKCVAPFSYIKRHFTNAKGLNKVTNIISDIVWNHFTQSGPILMLAVNAISVLSSHLAQIKGLEKSNRENKEYLINQEKFEMGLDFFINLVIPAYINSKLTQIFQSGKFKSEENDRKFREYIAQVIGADKDELYNPKSVPTLTEKGAKKIIDKIEKTINNDGYDKTKTQGKILGGIRKFTLKILEPTRLINRGKSIREECLEFDDKAQLGYVPPSVLHNFRNKSAFDEIAGMYEGFTVILTIGYMVVAGNIIMPIIKNLLANRKYRKELEAAGETKESMKRKKRFAFTEVPVFPEKPEITTKTEPETHNLLDLYSESPFDVLKSPFDVLKSPPQNKKLFGEFDSYTRNYSQSTGLRI